MTYDHAMAMVTAELARARELHPWPACPHDGASIVAEEAGELTKASNDWLWHDGPAEDMVTEAVHTAATAIRFLVDGET